MHRRPRLHTAVVALALAACGGGGNDASAPALPSTAFSATTPATQQSMPEHAAPSTARRAPSAPLDAAALDTVVPDAIAWAPCPELASVECGVLRLPVD